MSKPVFSITVILGYINQQSFDPKVKDEFDALKGLVNVNCPIELILVDRAWPNRWDRIKEALEPIIDYVRYVPVRPTKPVKAGMFAVSGAMNSGAICSSGDLLLSSGDFSQFTAAQIKLMYTGWYDLGILYAPVVDFSWGIYQTPHEVHAVTGLNVGPRLYTRKMLIDIGGWEEALDGSRGRDDETIDLSLDMLLQEQFDMQRMRHPDLVIHKVPHKGSEMPQAYKAPWSPTPPWNRMRCNLAFAQRVLRKRRASGNYRTNLVVHQRDIDAMSEPCSIGHLHEARGVPPGLLEHSNAAICCCHRADRKKQLASYKGWVPPFFTGLQHRFDKLFHDTYGCMDPWPQITLDTVHEFLEETKP